MLQPRLTNHARHRLQQRGSRAHDVAVVVTHGDVEIPARQGCRYLQLSRKEAALLLQRGLLQAAEVDRARRLVVLLDPKGKVVTVLKGCPDRALLRRHGVRR